MKRVQAACICQTLHFTLKEEMERNFTEKAVREEVESYKAGLEKSRTKYKIVEENVQNDGSIVLKIIKQYNSADIGEYMK